MHHTVAVVLLGLCSIAGLVLVALGLPGLWLICAAVLVFGLLTSFHAIGFVTITIMVGLALLGELLELWLGFGLARRYGASPRAGWGALLGGLVGAVVGVPVPVVGSVIGAILGCFAGATIFEYATTRTAGTAVRAGWGALLGRVAASAAKVALGIVMTIVAIVAALRG
ncbi:MAG TPA: DUF456 family protein [Gemmatimonadales bacterium]|nr:DUF456 family protein [Gemmatimonadales bacterium]